MLTRTDRRRFPILLAVIAALAMAMLFSPVQAQEGSVPDKPRGLEATATHDSVTLTWDDPGDDSITGYVILRRIPAVDPQGQFSELVSDTGTDATTYTDDTVSAETRYTYRIKAINGAGTSERSRWSHVDVPAAPEAVEGDDPDEQDGEGDGGGAPGGPGKRANVSEPSDGECPGDVSTTCEVDVGGSVTGNISSRTDFDWFRVDLEADTRYQIDLEGEDTGRGTLPDPVLELYDGAGSFETDNETSGVGDNAREIYTPTATGTYYVGTGEVDGETGTYTLSVIVLGANGASEQDTDFPETTSTTGRVEVGASATGNIGTETDYDWFKVVLEANKTYQIDLVGDTGGGGTQPDPYLRNIHDASGAEISGTENDDVAGGDADSRVVFRPTAAGAYYLVASGYGGASDTGTYTLSVTELETRTEEGSTDFASSIATLGRVEVGGSAMGEIDPASDIDWFRVVLEAGKTYVFDLEGMETDAGTLGNPALAIRNGSTGSLISADDDGGEGLNSRFEFEADTSGIYYLTTSAALSATSGGTYTLSVREVETDDDSEGSTVLVSNIGQAEATLSRNPVGQPIGLQFTTGDNAAGYNLDSVEIAVGDYENVVVTVSLYSDSSGEPGSSIFNFTNPTSGITADAVNTFTAPANTTLAGSNTPYFIVFDGANDPDESTNRVRIFMTHTNDEDSGGATNAEGDADWEIADISHALDSGVWYGDDTDELKIRLKGSAKSGGDTPTVSTDATLSALSLGTGVTLSPAFASDTYAYTASVANDIAEVTVTPTTTDTDATFEYLDSSDAELDDEDTNAAGHQVELDVGDTVFKVKVTAEDGTTTQNYTVTVTRAACALNEGDIWCGVVTVGDITNDRHGFLGTTGGLSDETFSLMFETGTTNNYTILAIQVASELLYFVTDSGLTDTEVESLALHVDGESDPFVWSDSTAVIPRSYRWPARTGLDWSSETTVTLRLREFPRPRVTNVAVTSTPVLETDTYGAGERIEVSVTFSEAVDATSDTDFELNVSDDKSASLVDGSGTETLVFGYTVAPDEEDDNGIWIGDQDRTLVGSRVVSAQSGTITSVATSATADLTHDALRTQPDHKVDGTRSIVSVEVTSEPLLETDTYGAGETIQFTVTFTAAVDVTGDPVLEFLFDGSELRQAGDVSGSGTTELVFGYTVVSGDDDDNGLFIRDESDYNNPDGPVRLDSNDEIEFKDTSTDVPLYWQGRGTQSGHKVDGSRTTDNVAPAFTSSATFDAAENQTAAGTVLATDDDTDDSVTGYEITGGADQTFFSIGATSGVLTFDAAPNYEDAQDQGTDNTYVVEVTATSGTGTRIMTADQTITVTVTDVDTEAPGKPGAPTVSAASATSLSVSWSAPSNAGPAITDYDVQYRAGTSGDWSDGGHVGTATTATLTGLSENTSYQVQVRATNDEGTGDWSDSGSGTTDAAAADDCPHDTTTTCEVDVGGSATGTLDAGDRDWFKVELEADTRYQIDVEGVDTGRGTVADPTATVLDPMGGDLVVNSLSVGDTDSGVGKNARVIYAPTAGGTYFVQVRDLTTSTGTYTLSVIVLGANGNSEADTDFPETTSTSGRVEVGASATGNISTATDKDWFKVVLEADKTYQIDMKGVDGGGGTLVDPWLDNIRDSSGNEFLDTGHDDIGGEDDILDSRIIFTPTEAGTYYLVATLATTPTGTYTLSVGEVETEEPACTLNEGDIWCGVVDVGDITNNSVTQSHGFQGTTGDLSDKTFSLMFETGTPNDYTIVAIVVGATTSNIEQLYFVTDSGLTDTEVESLALHVDGESDPFVWSDSTEVITGSYGWPARTDLDWSSETTVTLRLREFPRPTVTNVAVTSMPELETDTYGAGETIEVSVTFSEAVNATTNTDFVLSVGGARRAPLLSGSGTATLVFGYTVVSSDEDTNGIWIGDETRTLVGNRNGEAQNGTITSVATGAAAVIAHTLLGTDSDHKVDGSRTTDNVAPAFTSSATFDAAENQTAAGTVLATDDDTDDSVTGYEITGGADQTFFSIGATSGVLTFDAAPNYEDAQDQGTDNTYVVEVTATSGTGTRIMTADQTITVTVTDVDTEAPGKPGAPTVSAASATSLSVSWSAPSNAGPAITDYDYRHRTTSPEGSWTEVTGTTITVLSATIGSLAENTSYDVQVRATNDEGTGDWSDSGSGTTDAAPSDDCSHDTTTTCEVEVGGSATGNIETQNDRDWFKVELEAGTRYQIDVEGADTDRGTQASPGAGLYDVSGTSLMVSDDDSGVGLNSRVIYTPTAASTYYVQASGLSGPGLGTYTLSVIVLGANGASEADTDFLDTTATTGKVEVGASATGNVESAADRDWFAVDLEAGKRYQFDLEGAPNGRGTQPDPFLLLYDRSATAIEGNDDLTPTNLNSAIVYDVTATGTYYLVARGARVDQTGTYTLSVRDITPAALPTLSIVNKSADEGSLMVFPLSLSEATSENVAVTCTATFGGGDTAVAEDLTFTSANGGVRSGQVLGICSFRSVQDTIVEEDETFTVTLSGVSSNAQLATDPTAKGTILDDDDPPVDDSETEEDDLPADTSTSGTVEVDGSAVRGDIFAPEFSEGDGPNEVDGWDFDTDWFEVELEADKTYRIDMWGHTTANGLTLRLPQINAIYDSKGSFIVNTWYSDESDSHYLFRVTFTASSNRSYYIAASGESFEWGTYKLWVKDITEDDHGDHGDEGDEGDGTNGGKGLKNLRAVEEKGGVRLTWQSPDGAAVTGYRIERRRAGGQGSGPQRSHGQPRDHHTLVEDTGNTETSYVDESAEQGVEYEYQVSAHNESGPGEESDWVRAGPEEEPVLGDALPGAPRNLTATPGNREVTLSWDPPDDNGNPPATRYRIEWRVDGKDYDRNDWGTSQETTYTTNAQANLANGVKYFFRVKAENDDGNSYGPYGPSSEEVSSTPTSGSAVDLGTPVLSDTETLHHGIVKLDWQDIEDAGWYVVQYYHVEDEEWLDLPAEGVDIAFHGSSAVVSNLHGLSWLRVGAASCDGASEWSQIEELYGTNASDWEGVPVPDVEEGDEIEPCPVVLGTPVLSDTEILHHGMVQLDWQDIEDAGWYVVQYYHLEGEEWLDLPAEGVDIAFHGSSAVVSNLHGLSWLRVGAASCDGASEWSQIEESYGTNASDWKGVPVPEVAEGDEIEPCSEDADTSDNSPATGAPTISGTAQVGETLTANTSGVADGDGLSNVQYEYQWLADDADISGATNATYTLVAADEGKAVKVQVSFTDDEGNDETLTSGATDTVEAAPTTNSPATGAPTISGTAQVGETLTADTSGIADADGLSNVQYEYQWLADDTDIAGATNATYTLTDSEESKAITVRVTFNDDADNEETLTSAATDAVDARPNSPATGAPTIAGTAQVGQTVTADTSGIADADGLANATFSFQWLADDSEIAGATGLTYTLTNTDEGKAITVQVSFTDDEGNAETLTSAATAAVAGAHPTEPPDKPTGLEATATHDSVTLTWDDPGDDTITGYVILRRIPGVDSEGHFDVLVADTGTDATTYTDDTVSAETRYTYRIKAINGAGTSERSRWSHIDTPAAPVPDKPTGLSATASHDSVTLTWDDPGDDSITGYVILRRVRENNTGGDFSVLVADTGTAATTYTDDTVAAGTTYTYRIKAINEHGTSERSRWYHIDIPAAP